VIKFATTLFPGKFNKYIYLDTDISPQAREEITLAGVVDPVPMAEISIEPRKAKLGTIQIDREKKLPLHITNAGKAPLVITTINSERTDAVYYDAAVKGEIEIAAGESRTIEIEIKPQKKGRLIDVIQVKCNARNAGTKGIYKILATAKVE